jgi:hypothetical protein
MSRSSSGPLSASRSSGDADVAHSEQVCCLIDREKKCKRLAGHASYNRRIQKIVFKYSLGLRIDDMVRESLKILDVFLGISSVIGC